MAEYFNTRNPILPLGYHVSDSEAHIMPDGRLYLYGSFDDRDDEYCSEKYHVVSTADMAHWTVHPVSMKGADVPWFNNPDAPKYQGIDWLHPTPFIMKMIQGMDIAKAQEQMEAEHETLKAPMLFAPDAIYKDGKYYLYFCMSDDSEGVAVADKPEGPFTNPVQLPCGGIDPAVFIDNDGKAYYYWGQLFGHGVPLNPDMISFDESKVVDNLVTEYDHFFHEGSSMRRIGDTYYYVYADMERGKPTALGYATGKSPLGPFTYRGIIIDNDGCDPASWNNHGSIECVDGQWYVFYHRCSRGSQQHRRLCIEKIQINPDGTIDEVKMTSQGVGDPFAPGEKIMGYQACGMKGNVRIDVDSSYEEVLSSISDGDEAVFRYVQNEAEWTRIDIQCSGSGCIQIYMDEQRAGFMEVENTDENYHLYTASIRMSAGVRELKLKFSHAHNLKVAEIILG